MYTVLKEGQIGAEYPAEVPAFTHVPCTADQVGSGARLLRWSHQNTVVLQPGARSYNSELFPWREYVHVV